VPGGARREHALADDLERSISELRARCAALEEPR
jgi:hypothetical protein